MNTIERRNGTLAANKNGFNVILTPKFRLDMEVYTPGTGLESRMYTYSKLMELYGLIEKPHVDDVFISNNMGDLVCIQYGEDVYLMRMTDYSTYVMVRWYKTRNGRQWKTDLPYVAVA